MKQASGLNDELEKKNNFGFYGNTNVVPHAGKHYNDQPKLNGR
jgi:hypothetical protein